MFATLLQIVGLVGLPVAGALHAGVPGVVAAVSVDLVYLGLAMERD